MTHQDPQDGPDLTDIDSIVDHEALREHDAVPFYEETDVVEEAVVDQMAQLPDLAGVGITNADGEVLFRRLTDTCSWKIPVATVEPDEDFADSIEAHVRDTIGFSVELDTIAGVWDIRIQTETGENTASRAFVIFRAALDADAEDLTTATPEGDPVEDAGWFEQIPPDADMVPGTDQFVD